MAPRLEPPRALVLVTLLAAALTVPLAAWGWLGPGAPLGNDNPSHITEVMRVAELARSGHTDAWYPDSNLGYPMFLAYQPLPTLLLGVLASCCSSFEQVVLLYKASVFLLWGLLPFSAYLGGRWLGLDRLEALLLGVLCLAPHDPVDLGITVSSVATQGVYTQLHGLLLLPLVLGACWRWIVRGDMGAIPPACLLALTLLCHAFFGMLAGIGALLMLFVDSQTRSDRLRRLAPVLGIAFALVAWWVLPLLLNGDYAGGPTWRSSNEDGWHVADLLTHLFTGSVFDDGRFPWLTILVAGGFVHALGHRDRGVDRWILMLGAVSALGWMGRETFGGLYDLVPLHGSLPAVRYVAGVHLAGILLAARGVAHALRSLSAWGESKGPLGAGAPAVVLAALVSLHLVSHAQFAFSRLVLFRYQRDPYAAGAAWLAAHPGGRYVTDERLGSVENYNEYYLGALSGRPRLLGSARGQHDTLSTWYLSRFDLSPAACRLYNVRHLISRGAGPTEMPGFERAFSQGDLRVLALREPAGYFELLSTPVTLVADLRRDRQWILDVSLALYQAGSLPLLAEATSTGSAIRVREDGLELTQAGASEVVGEATALIRVVELWGAVSSGAVMTEQVELGGYAATVTVPAPSRLVLKASYHPYWEARVDGVTVPIDLVGPNLMAIGLPPGEHTVRFVYRNPLWQKLLLLAALLATPGLLVLARRFEAEPEPEPEPGGGGGAHPGSG